MRVKTFSKLAALFGLCLAAPASGAIIVTTLVSGAADGVQAQAVIENTSTFGNTFLGVAVKEFRGTIIVRDDVVPPPSGRGGPALQLTKKILTPAQTWGQGQSNGYTQPPFTDPEGPWQGLVWPYRDQYDYFAQPGDPLADNVGTPFSDSPDVYGFLNVAGIARGGPTEPEIPSPGMGTVAWLNRGLTGNGLDGPATYFLFGATPLSGDPNRFIRVRVIDASAVIVQKDANGVYSEVTIPVPNSQDFFIQLPEPSAAALGLVSLGLTLKRRLRLRQRI